MDTDALQEVVEQQHNCIAVLCDVVQIAETFKGDAVWEGEVLVFVVDHPEASMAYAWADPVPDSTRLRYFAVLGKPPINSARDAVRAAIAARYRDETQEQE